MWFLIVTSCDILLISKYPYDKVEGFVYRIFVFKKNISSLHIARILIDSIKIVAVFLMINNNNLRDETNS